jgi:hypothetical protein
VPPGIEDVTFTPRDIRVVKGRPSRSAAYSFRSTLPFSDAAAMVRLTENGHSTLVNSHSFDRMIQAGETVSGDWDGMRDGSPSLGSHKLFIRAWRTRERNGGWSFASSYESVLVRL